MGKKFVNASQIHHNDEYHCELLPELELRVCLYYSAEQKREGKKKKRLFVTLIRYLQHLSIPPVEMQSH